MQGLYNGEDDLVVVDNTRSAILPLASAACGATLIASDVAITAAHCVNDPADHGRALVIVGAPNREDPDAPLFDDRSVPFRIGADVLIYPGYQEDGSPEADVAILLLDKPFHRGARVPMRIAFEWGRSFPEVVETFVFGVYEHTVADDCLEEVPLGTVRIARLPAPALLALDEESWGLPDAANAPPDSTVCKGDSGSAIVAREVPGLFEEGILSVNSKVVTIIGRSLHGPNLSQLGIKLFLEQNALDRDGDGVRAPIDNCDTEPNAGQSDSDGDGIGDPCDECAHMPFEWRHDRDGDQVPDCADPCPDTPPRLEPPAPQPCGFAALPHGDQDCDGICDGVDACALVANPSLRNSNHFAETRWGAGALPDACEPVLVPRLDPQPAEPVESYSRGPSLFRETVTRYVQDRIDVTRLRSRSERGQSNESTADTHFRFCHDLGDDGFCRRPENVNYDHLHIGRSDLPGDPYLRVKLLGFPRGMKRTGAYDDTTSMIRWQFEADEAFWTGSTPKLLEPIPRQGGGFLGEEDVVDASGLRGVFWAHTDHNKGHFGFDGGTGTHGPDLDGKPQLAASYVDLAPEYILRGVEVGAWTLDQPYFAWRDLPYPPWDERGLTDPSRPGEDLLVYLGPGDDLASLGLEGRGRLLPDALGPGLLERLGEPGLLWANAAEVHLALGQGRPIAVAIDPIVGRVVDTVTASIDGGALLGALDRVREDGPVSAAQTSSSSGSSGPHLATYSRLHGEVWVLGGTEPGAPPESTARRALVDGDGELLDVELNAPLGTVLASVVSTMDGRLWVLDQLMDEGGTHTRLLRIQRAGGQVEVLASRRHPRLYQRFFLGLDRDGSVLLQASRGGQGNNPGHHAIFRLTPSTTDEATIFVDRLHRGPGALELPVLVDDDVQTLWLRRKGKLEGSRLASWEEEGCDRQELESEL